MGPLFAPVGRPVMPGGILPIRCNLGKNGQIMHPVRQLRSLAGLAVIAAAISVISIKTSAAADAGTPAADSQGAERLACLEATGNPVGDQEPQTATEEERSMIINRCLAQTGEFGAAMVRACAEKDLASFEALLAYPEACAPLVVRCAKRVGQHSWGMVKICVDKDIGREPGEED